MARIETQIPRRKKPLQQRTELESEWEVGQGARQTHLKMTSDLMKQKEGGPRKPPDPPRD